MTNRLLLVFAFLLFQANPLAAATPPTPVPPADYIIPGRTFDPAEPLVTPVRAGARIFHVSTAGNDSNPGTAALPFRTVQHGVNLLSLGNDTVLIHGGLYRERISLIGVSAPTGNPFVIGPAGDGEVILDSSPAVSGWTLISGTVYRAAPGFAVGNVVVDNQPLYREPSLAALQASPTLAGVPTDLRYFYDSAGGNLYVRIAGGSPAGRDVGVIKDVSDEDGVFFYDCDNVTIYGLTVRFAGGRGINMYGGDNVLVQENKVVFNHHTGLTTIRIDNTSRGANARILRNYVYFNFMLSWPRGDGGWVWGGWGAGMGIQGTPFALVEGNISQKNGGEGILTYDGEGGTTFRNNVSADNWSVSFYYDNLPNGVIEGNFAVAHRPDATDLYNNGHLPADADGGYTRGLRLLRPIGVMTADEDYGNGANLNNVLIRNNILLNTRKGLEHYPAGSVAATSGLKNVKVINNTILIPSDRFSPYEDDLGGISIPYNNGNNTGSYYQNNLIMNGDSQSYAMRMVDGGAIANLFLGLTIDHNLIYTPANGAPFLWGGNWGTNYTHAQWVALAGAAHGAGDVAASPNLVLPAGGHPFAFRPQIGSPALNAGVTTAFAPADFEGTARPQGAAYDLGAFEWNGAQPAEVSALQANALRAGKGTVAGTVTLSFDYPAGMSGFNVYEGILPMAAATPYSHGGAAGNVCNVATTLAAGRRATPAAGLGTAGSHYYLVTGFTALEGPSGRNSAGVEISPALNSCFP